MISRYFVILLAFSAAAYRFAQGAFVEGTGLAALGGGLVILKLSAGRPALKPLAYLAFVVTALSMGVVLIRNYY